MTKLYRKSLFKTSPNRPERPKSRSHSLKTDKTTETRPTSQKNVQNSSTFHPERAQKRPDSQPEL